VVELATPPVVDDAAGRGDEFAFHSDTHRSRLPANLATTMDVRDKADLAALRRTQGRDLLLWRIFLGSLAAIGLMLLGLVVLAGFNPAAAGFQFEERAAWITSLNVHYHLGLDGLSLLLVLLTGIVGPAGLLAAWKQPGSPRAFGILFLILQGSALGVFLALDFFHWFLLSVSNKKFKTKYYL